MRALAITRTMCCAGGRQILFVFVSGLGELGKPGKAGFSLRGYTTEEKKPHCWPKLTSIFFLKNSTCVLAWGEREEGEREHHGTVRRGVGNRTQSRPASQPSSLLPGLPTPPPQAATCSSCQPEGLKFLQLEGPMLKLGKQTGAAGGEMQRN